MTATQNSEHRSKGSDASHRAWETYAERAVEQALKDKEEEQSDFFRQLDAEIRALTDSNLSNGAARLFNLLCKLGWKKELGGLYRDRLGSILIDSRRLAKLCGGASVNSFYHKTRPEKRDKDGKLLRPASETDGWIEELVNGGYIWISKHRIPNIPPAKWPNVYNVTCHVPQRVTPHLPWADGNWGGEVAIDDTEQEGCVTVRDSNFHASELPVDRESQQNHTSTHRNGQHAVGRNGASPSPERPTGKHRNGQQPVTGTANGQAPKRITGKHRNGQQAVGRNGNGHAVNPVHLRETGDTKNTPEIKKGSAPPQFGGVEELQLGLRKMFLREKEALEQRFKANLKGATTPEAKREWKLRLEIVQASINGGSVADEPAPAKPAAKAEEKPVTSEERKRMAAQLRQLKETLR